MDTSSYLVGRQLAMKHLEMRIVNFHGIGEPCRELEFGEAPFWITEKQFVNFLDEIEPAKERVLVTFDDGNFSDINIGAEWLEKRKIKAIFFPLAGRLNEKGSLSASDLRTLLSSDHVIGTHGFNHVSWMKLDQYGVQKELVDARVLLEDCIGVKINDAAIPFGKYGRQTLQNLRLLDYRYVYSSDAGSYIGAPFPIPRWSVRMDTKPQDIRDFLSGNENTIKKMRRALSKFKKQIF